MVLSACSGLSLNEDDPCVQEAQRLNTENHENVETLAEVYNKSVGDMKDAFDATFKRMIERCEVKAEKKSKEEPEAQEESEEQKESKKDTDE